MQRCSPVFVSLLRIHAQGLKLLIALECNAAWFAYEYLSSFGQHMKLCIATIIRGVGIQTTINKLLDPLFVTLVDNSMEERLP